MKVVICGPNLNDQRKGQFHIHAAGCHDLVKNARREPEYKNGWTIDAHSREDVVRNIYSDHMAEHDSELKWMRENPNDKLSQSYADQPGGIPMESDWRHYDDVYMFPCCNLPDESSESDFDSIKKVSETDGKTLAATQFDIDTLANAVADLIGDDKAESLSDKEWDDMLIAYLNGMVRGFTKQIESLKSDIK
jgi:hypothetical protein